jgi:hypothetical protein
MEPTRHCFRADPRLRLADLGLAYCAGKAITSGRAARRQGIANLYRIVTALDHRNHFPSLLAQMRHVFGHDALTVVWALPRPGWHLNAFAVIHARIAR